MMGKREALHAILNGQRADRIPVIMNAFSLPVARYGYTMAQVMQQPDKMEVGDTVLTTSGFYGVIIDITDDDLIVEFGNNKNCRIPMQKAAIAQVEKASAE